MDSLWNFPIGGLEDSFIESDGPSAAPPSVSEDEYPDLKEAYAQRRDTSRRKRRARQQAEYEREKEKEKEKEAEAMLKKAPPVADGDQKASGTRTKKVKKEPGAMKHAKKASLRQDIEYDRDVMNGIVGNPAGIDSDPSSVSIPTSESQLQARFSSSSDCGDTGKLDVEQSMRYSPLSFMRDASTIEIPEPQSFWSDEKEHSGLPLVDNLHFEPQSPAGNNFDFVFSGNSDTQSALENLPMPFHTNSSPTLSDLTSSGSPTRPYTVRCMAPAKRFEKPNSNKHSKTPEAASSKAVREKFNIEDWQDRLHQKLGIDDDFEIELRSPSTISSSSKHHHSSAPLQPVSANSANTPKTPSAGPPNNSPPVRKATVSLPKRKEPTTYTNPPQTLHDFAAYKLPTPSPIPQHDPSPKQQDHLEEHMQPSPPSSSSAIDDEDGYNTATVRRSIASKIFNTFRRRGGGTSLTPYVPTSMVDDGNNTEGPSQRPRIINRFKRHPKSKPQF
ncbi:hypothetical protein TRICI_004829 [Trichomonascus ciferrii]|uniref:Uncharacterized protein n=1 Tax=Trichomonascus ciferrii TaxID=44093 RepID=A0A642UYY0_9ASCO|nr:hypothetical protein TRICI_004829 [Trichomonascus ciferrii]